MNSLFHKSWALQTRRFALAVCMLSTLPAACVQDSGDNEPPEVGRHAQSLCTDTPSAHWTLDETMGGVASDSTSAGNDGVHLGGPTPALGQLNGALSFDGINDYVEVASAPEINVGTGDFSISYLIKTQTTQLDVIVDKRVESSGPVRGYVAYIYSGNVGFQLANGSGWSNFSASASIADNQWHQVIISVDRDSPTGLKFYVDGTLVATSNPMGRQGDLSTSMPLRIGRRSDAGSGYFLGVLDDVKIYKSAIDGSCSPVDPCADPSTATIIGTAGDDYLLGTSGNDIIFGLGGDDIILGKGGNDILCGGDGLDSIQGGDGDDFVGGGSGYNWLQGNAGDDTIVGGNDGNELQGNLGEDTLTGGDGQDTIYCGEGNDFADGGASDDYILGHEGNDQLLGGDGDDHLQGNAGHDCLDGGVGDDRLSGGDGDDCLAGGSGIDQVSCGDGNDNYSGGEWDYSGCESAGACLCSQ